MLGDAADIDPPLITGLPAKLQTHQVRRGTWMRSSNVSSMPNATQPAHPLPKRTNRRFSWKI